MSNKKEYQIGEKVRIHHIIGICTEAKLSEDCEDCCFSQVCDEMIRMANVSVCGYCSKECRTDNKNVIFKLKEE